jgi:glycosyltransferase involved in cell wall biosynthesis
MFIWLERLAAHVSDVILTISDGLRDDLIALRIAPAQRIRVIPLGLPLRQYAKLDDVREGLRRELGYSTEHVLVGIIGRLVPIKNHRLFLSAADLVAAHMARARFVIVGDGECRSEIEADVAALGLEDVVRLLGWRRDLRAIYADLDVVVISSRNEGTPVSLIEAMAAGVPVVSTAVGGVPDLLQSGALGVLVPSDDATALAEAIVATIERGDPERVERAQRRVLGQYDAARLVADIKQLYLELTDSAGT